jgi:hypothetical protein
MRYSTTELLVTKERAPVVEIAGQNNVIFKFVDQCLQRAVRDEVVSASGFCLHICSHCHL